MLSYNLAPVPFWYFRDQLGKPLANGYMFAYRNTVRSELKAVYSDMGGIFTYVQPITFDASGGAGPFYWASDENYYLEIFDSNGALVHTVEDFNAPQDGGVTPINKYSDFNNFLLDPQFKYAFKELFSPAPANETKISNSEWYFTKDGNSSATDTIEFKSFGLGDTVPPYNPERHFRYECTAVGSGESRRDLVFKWPAVKTFQQQVISIALYAKADAPRDVEVFFIQDFGTGGSPSATVLTPIVTLHLTTSWAAYSQNNFTVLSVAGKSLGSDDNDYAGLVFRLPLDATCQIDLVNFQMNLGAAVLPFDLDYRDRNLTATNIVPAWNPFKDRGKSLYLSQDGEINWSHAAPIGAMIWWPANGLAPSGWLYCRGESLLKTDYPVLFSIIGTTFGGDATHFNLPDSRGIFIRGYDDGRGEDPGRGFASFQNDALQDHLHEVGLQFTDVAESSPNTNNIGLPEFSSKVDTTSIKAGTAKFDPAETRPKNIALNMIIRVL